PLEIEANCSDGGNRKELCICRAVHIGIRGNTTGKIRIRIGQGFHIRELLPRTEWLKIRSLVPFIRGDAPEECSERRTYRGFTINLGIPCEADAWRKVVLIILHDAARYVRIAGKQQTEWRGWNFGRFGSLDKSELSIVRVRERRLNVIPQPKIQRETRMHLEIVMREHGVIPAVVVFCDWCILI